MIGMAIAFAMSVGVSATPAPAAARPVEIHLSQPPIQVGGTTLVPMRGIFEWLGATVDYDKKSGKVMVTSGEGAGKRIVTLRIGDTKATIAGREVTLGSKPRELNGTVFVPLRFVGEAFGATVGFDESSGVVSIALGQKRGYVTVPLEPLPTPYRFEKEMAMAQRLEKDGDRARRGGNRAAAARRYRTAIMAAEDAFRHETDGNLMYEAAAHIRRAYAAYKAGDYDTARAYRDAAQGPLAEAQRRGVADKQRHSVNNADNIGGIRDRLEKKLSAVE
jgi:hypothetical protein